MSELLKFPRIFIPIMLVSFASVSGLLVTPGFPEIAKEFKLSNSNLQWVMSIFLLGYCLGQLPYGPIANRIGRKKTIYLGFAIAFIGCAIVFVSENFAIFCLGRFIQALGAAVGLKITFTMISDLHVGHSATKAIGYITVSFAITLGIGTAIGGFIVSLFGWRGCFAALLIYTVFLYLCCLLLLPETSKHLDREALKIKNIGHAYSRQFKDSFLVLHALLMGLGTAIFYVFSTEAPSIAIDFMKLTPSQYGLFSLIPAFGMGVGLISAAQIAERVRPRIIMVSGILTIILGVLLMSLFFAKGWEDAWSLFFPAGIIFFGSSLPWVFSSSVGTSEATNKSNASAVLQFINVSGAFIGTLLAGELGPKVPFTIPVSLGLISLMMLGIWLSLRAHHRKKGHA